jgi:hypothetical protein
MPFRRWVRYRGVSSLSCTPGDISNLRRHLTHKRQGSRWGGRLAHFLNQVEQSFQTL